MTTKTNPNTTTLAELTAYFDMTVSQVRGTWVPESSSNAAPSISEAAGRSAQIARNLSRTHSFRTLPPDWNAQPISKAVLDRSIALLLTGVLLTYPPHVVNPTGRNSVQFEYHLGETYLEIEVFAESIGVLLEVSQQIVVDEDNVSWKTVLNMVREYAA